MIELQTRELVYDIQLYMYCDICRYSLIYICSNVLLVFQAAEKLRGLSEVHYKTQDCQPPGNSTDISNS